MSGTFLDMAFGTHFWAPANASFVNPDLGVESVFCFVFESVSLYWVSLFAYRVCLVVTSQSLLYSIPGDFGVVASDTVLPCNYLLLLFEPVCCRKASYTNKSEWNSCGYCVPYLLLFEPAVPENLDGTTVHSAYSLVPWTSLRWPKFSIKPFFFLTLRW